MANLITEAQLKAWLNIDDSSDDGLLAMITGTASQMIRSYCGRSFEVDTAQAATARYFDRVGYRSAFIDDCWSITSVATDDGDDGTYSQVWTTSDYQADPVGGIGPFGLSGWPYTSLTAIGDLDFPVVDRPAVKVTAKWGWTALPTEVLNATLMMAGEIYKGRSGGFEVFTADANFTPIRRNMLVRDALAPYRTRRAHDVRFAVL